MRGHGGGQRGARGGARGGSRGGSHSSKASSNGSESHNSHPRTNRVNSKRDSNSQRSVHRPALKSDGAPGQESKFKLLGIPKNYWTKEIYQAMSAYGNVFRIEMEVSSRDSSSNAYVVFR
jgi:RNA-dependent RNA polymerase